MLWPLYIRIEQTDICSLDKHQSQEMKKTYQYLEKSILANGEKSMCRNMLTVLLKAHNPLDQFKLSTNKRHHGLIYNQY